MDKYGYMYRYDSVTNRIIKVASLDGESIDYFLCSEDVNINSEDVGYTNIGFDFVEESDGTSTLYYWGEE